MDPVDDEGAVSTPASPRPGRVRGASSTGSARLDRWLTIGVWAAAVAVVAFAGFFAYSVYAQQQAARLSSSTSLAVDALQGRRSSAMTS